MTFYTELATGYAAESLYDILAGRYVTFGLNNEEKRGYQFGQKASMADFTPAALRNAGVR